MKYHTQTTLILYASQTGNALDAADRIGREAARRHFRPRVCSVSCYNPAQLPTEDVVIFVASTAGQGDPPDSMKSFWQYLLRKILGETWLQGLHYAVFGLGDSGYLNYNVTAKKLDRRLLRLGGTPIIPLGLGDDQHHSGYEAALDPWLKDLWTAMRVLHPLPEGLTDPGPDELSFLSPPKYYVHYHEPGGGPQPYDCPAGVQGKWDEYRRAFRMISAAGEVPFATTNLDSKGIMFSQPVLANVVVNKRITSEDCLQDVRHIEFDLKNSSVQYEPGDILSVLPSQDSQAIDAFLERCNLDGDALISVAVEGMKKEECGLRLRTFVEATMDVSSASPSRYFFEVMSHFATAEHEKERLQYFATSEGRDELYQYNQKERRSVLEVLEDFPSVQMPLEWLVQLVPRMRPRAFSISSSLRAHPNHACITVAIVKWVTPLKRKRQGLCSRWLSQLDPAKGTAVVPCWISQGAMKLPPPSVPLILVGPGTGCAPFRSFIQDRTELAKVQSVSPVLFFFGCRNHDKDFLYKEFWQECAGSGGILSRECGGGLYVAFSRDQEKKVYVQDKILEASKLVWKTLQAGGAIFVAGSANKMPADVAKAFEDVIVRETGWPSALAGKWLKALESSGRYVVEAWS